MKAPTISNKKRLIITLSMILLLIFGLIVRIGYLQIIKGEEYKKRALKQWTRGIPVKPERGIIYDRNKKKLAVSVSKDTIWARPEDLNKKKLTETSKKLAEILELDDKQVLEDLKSEQNLIKIKQWVEKEQSEKIKKADIKGIEIVEDNKRQYPKDNFAAHIIGHTNIDQVGQYGIERVFNEQLTGTAGKWVKKTDAFGRQLPQDSEKLYDAENGVNVVLTIDETIQGIAEDLSNQAYTKHNSKNTSIIVMDVKTGEILAMANKPDYNLNKPRMPANENLATQWEELPEEERQDKWFEMWRNYSINDSYEPGSTFKVLTVAGGLEENLVNENSQFYCGGKITRVKDGGSCVTHGTQNLAEAFRNSCNVAVADINLDMGSNQVYKYIKSFGLGEKTEVSLTGETSGLIPSKAEDIKDLDLTTISYGYGVAVTPMQLITSVSSIVNGGNLMKPQIVKELTDADGKTLEKYHPELVRKPISKQTSNKMLELLERVAESSIPNEEFVPGYRVGGKTGTARKIVNGKYRKVYVSSFVGVAPIEDPKFAVLVIVDEPDISRGGYYGNLVAKPFAGELIKQILEYLNVEPEESSKKEDSEIVIVPDLIKKNMKNAGEILLEHGLDYDMDAYSVEPEDIIRDQFPVPGTQVKRGSIIELYLENKEK